MVQTSQQFTPPQLLENGRRAESEGRLDLAQQFYRHLAEHYPLTSEAAEARNGLGRVGAAQSQIWHPNGAAQMHGAPRPQRRRPVAPRDHYRAGRALARLLSALGWIVVVCGFAGPVLYIGLDIFAPSMSFPRPGLALVAAGVLGLIATGLLAVFVGHIARAVFDQANAARDLAALERAKLGSD
jgi:hypothetical protein